MKKRPESPYFRKVIEALGVASPLCLAAHFEDGLAHCVEASISGAAALRRRKIQAQAIPCAIVGSRDGDVSFAVGLSARGVYEFVEATGPFEEWARGSSFPEDKRFHAHMVIEARFAGERAIIDLTYGQLRQGHGLDVPLHLLAFGDGWPRSQGPGWKLAYMDSPHAAKIREETKIWVGKGLTDDLHDMMEAALYCGCDRSRFLALLRSQQPELVDAVLPRLARFMELGGPPSA